MYVTLLKIVSNAVSTSLAKCQLAALRIAA